MVVARVLRHDPRIEYLKEAGHPFVAFGRSDSATYPYIDVDGAKAISQVVEHFVHYGHRRIGMILSPPELHSRPAVNYCESLQFGLA
jgi:LacI family transcriptional regulator